MAESEKPRTGNAEPDELAEGARNRLEGKRGRGRPRKDDKGRFTSAAPDQSSPVDRVLAPDVERLQRIVETLYDPNNLKTLVNAYPSYRLYLTGRQHWKWSDERINSCAKPLGVLLELWTRTDPMYMALAIFAANFGSSLAEGFMLDANINRREKEAKATGVVRTEEAHNGSMEQNL